MRKLLWQVISFFLVVAAMTSFGLAKDEKAPKNSPDSRAASGPSASTEEIEDLRDPFATNLTETPPPRIVAKGKTQSTSVNLHGIGMSAAGSFVILNGQIYTEGEEKGGIIVTQIRKKEVDIIIDKTPMTLYTSGLQEVKQVQPEPAEQSLPEGASELEPPIDDQFV